MRVTLCALVGGLATLWHALVLNPAISDYTELHEVMAYIRDLIF